MWIAHSYEQRQSVLVERVELNVRLFTGLGHGGKVACHLHVLWTTLQYLAYTCKQIHIANTILLYYY